MDDIQSNEATIAENFALQLSEVEMLSSMYPSNSEFYIVLPSIVADMHKFIDGKTRRLPSELDFTLNIEISDVKERLEVNITYPHEYPAKKPSISCRSVGLNRTQQKELNSAAVEYVNTLPLGEMCVISLINWLIENAGNYFSLQPSKSESEMAESEVQPVPELMCRMWIYSHHIYNKFKRRDIVDYAQTMNLTGFSLPGKPGFICIEGTKKECNEFYLDLRHMSWKKISLVKEEVDVSENFRKFDSFQEITFKVRKGPAREYHMDMGKFLKYLEEHDCSYAFHDLFGLEGHTSADK